MVHIRRSRIPPETGQTAFGGQSNQAGRQTDPIGYADGLNLYAYVGGDPVNFSDPGGLEGCPLGTKAVPMITTQSSHYERDMKRGLSCVTEEDDIVVNGVIPRAITPGQGTGYIHYGSEISGFFQEGVSGSAVGQGSPRNTVATSPDELPYPRSSNSRNPAQATNGCTNVPNASPMACNSHDVCYGTYGTSKELCDYQLHENMVTENRTWIGRLAAKIYYFGVAVFGRRFYDNAQKRSANFPQ